MKPFEYYRVTTVEQAIALLQQHGSKAALLAGGSDLFGIMKDRIAGPEMAPPEHLIDVRQIKGAVGITETAAGLRIGAATVLADLAASPVVAAGYPLLADAARQIGVPQIRNAATVGGNLCQKPRCWYWRGKLFTDCLRKGGGTCYAQEPASENQNHAIVGNVPCAMVCPSDLAPALVALDARAEIAGPTGRRTVAFEKFYTKPDDTFKQETVLGPQELLVAVEVPTAAKGQKGVYVKFRERQAFDFALVSVAVSATVVGGKIVDARVAFGGLAAYPLRSRQAEAMLKGMPVGAHQAALKSAVAEACAAALKGAAPLSKNGHKREVAKGVLEQALIALA